MFVDIPPWPYISYVWIIHTFFSHDIYVVPVNMFFRREISIEILIPMRVSSIIVVSILLSLVPDIVVRSWVSGTIKRATASAADRIDFLNKNFTSLRQLEFDFGVWNFAFLDLWFWNLDFLILHFGFWNLVTVVTVVGSAALPKGEVDLPKGECVAATTVTIRVTNVKVLLLT